MRKSLIAYCGNCNLSQHNRQSTPRVNVGRPTCSNLSNFQLFRYCTVACRSYKSCGKLFKYIGNSWECDGIASSDGKFHKGKCVPTCSTDLDCDKETQFCGDW